MGIIKKLFGKKEEKTDDDLRAAVLKKATRNRGSSLTNHILLTSKLNKWGQSTILSNIDFKFNKWGQNTIV